MSNGARWYTPDIFGGPVYTPEELGAVVDGETGEVIDAPTPRVVTKQPASNGDWKAGPSGEKLPADPPGFEVWADWRNQDDAIAWGLSQGVFGHENHARNAYAKVKAECAPKKASDMWQCWYLDVQRRIAEKAAQDAAQQPADADADPDGWQDIDANGVEVPNFN